MNNQSVEVWIAQERDVRIEWVACTPDSTFGDIVRAVGIDELAEQVRVGSYGKLRVLDEKINLAERVEIYRPLKISPTEARRLRAQRSSASAKRGK